MGMSSMYTANRLVFRGTAMQWTCMNYWGKTGAASKRRGAMREACMQQPG